jgi:hypothetical protein
MRLALVAVLAVGIAVLVVATRASGQRPGAGATVVTGSNVYAFADGSCQTAGGDLSVAVASDGIYFHLIWNRKDHGGYRSVAWRYSYLNRGVLIRPTIRVGKDAAGRPSGTFSGLSTTGVRTTGKFSCG